MGSEGGRERKGMIEGAVVSFSVARFSFKLLSDFTVYFHRISSSMSLHHDRSTALGEEGLYRVSGNKLDVDRLKAVLAAGLLSSSDILQVHYPDKHVIAGAIKKVRGRSLV